MNSEARKRALRAALAVTAVSGLVGCAESHTTGDASVGDAEVVMDAVVVRDAGPADAGCGAEIPQTEDCCNERGWFWDGSECLNGVPGPFVPPEMV